MNLPRRVIDIVKNFLMVRPEGKAGSLRDGKVVLGAGGYESEVVCGRGRVGTEYRA